MGKSLTHNVWLQIGAGRCVAALAVIACVLASSAFSQSTQTVTPQRRGGGGFVATRGNGWRLVGGQWVRPMGTCAWDELIGLSWRDGELVAVACPAEDARAMLRGGRAALIELQPRGDLYLATQLAWRARPGAVNARPWTRLGFGESNLSMHFVPDRGADARGGRPPLRITQIDAERGVLSIAGSGWMNDVLVEVKFDFAEGKRVMFSVGEPGNPQSRVNHVADVERMTDLLSDEHVRATRTYLSPLLRPLANGQDVFGPGAADVYGSFVEIEPSPAARQALDALLPKLGSDDPADRDAAAGELRDAARTDVQLVCAARQVLGAGELSPQQRALLESFISDQSRHPEPDARLRRRNELFLIDCLEFDDARVRDLAGRALSERLGRSIDVGLTSKPRGNALAAELRASHFARASAPAQAR